MSRRLPVLAAALLATAAALSGTERVVFHPDWFPGAQFAGLYVAQDTAAFADAGLEVVVAPFAFGRDAPAAMDREADVPALGSAEGYIFLQQRAGGADLCAFAAVLQESPAGFITLRASGIGSARDLAGRTLGVHAYATPFVRWFLVRAGLDADAARLVPADSNLNLLADGRVDALQGYAIEEFVLAQRRFGDAVRFLSFAELGFPSSAQVVYTTRTQLERHEAVLRRFVDALRAGWQRALADPDRALAAVMRRLEPDADRAAQRAMLAALRPYVAPAGAAPLPPPDPEKWRRMSAACVAIGLLSRAEDPRDFLLAPVLPAATAPRGATAAPP